MVDSNVKLPPPDDKVLRAWFDGHRDKYDEPPRFDFEEAALSGNASEAAVRDFVKALNRARQATPRPVCESSRDGRARTWSRVTGRSSPRLWKQAKPGVWHAFKTQGRLARDPAQRDRPAEARRVRVRARAWCCRTGRTPWPRSSEPPRCARWRRSTRSSTKTLTSAKPR